jgi:hypothetical protein
MPRRGGGRTKRGRLRLRPEWLRRARWSVIGAACGIGLAGVLWFGLPPGVRWFKSHTYFALTSISVDGNRRMSRAEILEWADLHDGMSIWDAAPGAVRSRLRGHPWVQHVSVQREFPRSLSIRLQERRPVAIALLDQAHYIDRGGNILGPLRADDSRDFPIITGLEGTEAQGFTVVAVHRALQLLRWCERLNCFDAVSEVHVDRSQGVTVFPLRSAVAVVLGWGSWRQKLARSARVFAAWEGQVGRLMAVDVSFRDLVVVRLHEEPHPAAGRSVKRGTRV